MRPLRLTRESLGARSLRGLVLARVVRGVDGTREMAYRFPPYRGENRRGEVPDDDG